jgi:hypothetical protein
LNEGERRKERMKKRKVDVIKITYSTGMKFNFFKGPAADATDAPQL